MLLPKSFFAASFWCFGFIFNIFLSSCSFPPLLSKAGQFNPSNSPSPLAQAQISIWCSPSSLVPCPYYCLSLPTKRARKTGLQLVFINRTETAGLNSPGLVFVLVKRKGKGRTDSWGHTPRLYAEQGTCSSMGREKGANPDLVKGRAVSSISKEAHPFTPTPNYHPYFNLPS